MPLTRTLIALLFTFSLTARAGGLAGAALTTTGTVWTNAVALPSGTTVQNGDHIVTARGAVALIWSRTIGRVEIRENSEVTIGDDDVRLHRGVVASERVPIVFRQNVAKSQAPETSQSWFVVSDQQQSLVAAHRGDVLISPTGAAPFLVPAGFYAVPPGDEDSEPVVKKGKTDKGEAEKKTSRRPTRGAAAAGGVVTKTAGGWTIGSLGHAASVALVAGVGAAAVGGTIAAVGLSESSPSPSQ